MDVQALPYITLLGVLFGTTLIASRFSVGQFSPYTYIAARLTLASLAHVLFYLFAIQGRKCPANPSLWRRAALLGIIGTALPMTLISVSLTYLSSGIVSILITVGPAITVLMAHYTLADERLNRRKIIGVTLALSGALMLTLLGESGLPDVNRASPVGYFLVILAMTGGSSMTIFARKYMRHLDSFDVASVRMFSAALVMIPLSLLLAGFDLSGVNQQGVFALGWAALAGTFFGMMLGFYNIKRFGATPAAMTAYVIPVVASIGGVILLGETITLGMLAGMALIVLGIAILNQRSKRVQLPENV